VSHSIFRSLVVAFVLAGVLTAAPARAQTFSTPWMHATNQDWASEWGVLDPMILFTPESWAQLKGATGGWDGVRSDLSNAGVSLFGSYESESAGNPVGGEVHKFRYTHNIALGIALDLHRLIGLEDTYFLASASERTGNSLSNDIPNTLQVQQIFGHQTSIS
jgi:hypothetical protein